MKKLKKTFARGILPILGSGILLLTWLTTGYSGEWKPKIQAVVKDTLEIEIKSKQLANPEAGTVGDYILVVPEGMMVKWINTDPLVTVNGEQGLMPHGIQISDETDKVFTASPILTEGQNSFSYTFDEAGTYVYGCFIHPFMKAEIVVVEMPG